MTDNLFLPSDITCTLKQTVGSCLNVIWHLTSAGCSRSTLKERIWRDQSKQNDVSVPRYEVKTLWSLRWVYVLFDTSVLRLLICFSVCVCVCYIACCKLIKGLKKASKRCVPWMSFSKDKNRRLWVWGERIDNFRSSHHTFTQTPQ